MQPKKETVRINLPPKPTAAPTIKLPTLPPGGPTGAPSAAPALATAHTAPHGAPPAPRPAGAPGASIARPAATAAQQRPASAARPAAPPPAPTFKTFDKTLIYAAGVAALLGVGFYCYVTFLVLKPAIDNFQP